MPRGKLSSCGGSCQSTKPTTSLPSNERPSGARRRRPGDGPRESDQERITLPHCRAGSARGRPRHQPTHGKEGDQSVSQDGRRTAAWRSALTGGGRKMLRTFAARTACNPELFVFYFRERDHCVGVWRLSCACHPFGSSAPRPASSNRCWSRACGGIVMAALLMIVYYSARAEGASHARRG